MFLPFGLLLGGIGAWIAARAVKRSDRSRSFGVWVIHGALCGSLLGASPLLMLASSGLDRGVLGLVAYGGMIPGALVGASAGAVCSWAKGPSNKQMQRTKHG
jgi:hypothetical protein